MQGACKKNGYALKYASDAPKANLGIVIVSVEKNGLVPLMFAKSQARERIEQIGMNQGGKA